MTATVSGVYFEALKNGATHELACQAGGISHQTFAEWTRLYPEFFEGIKK
jgi:hypothetical protein